MNKKEILTVIELISIIILIFGGLIMFLKRDERKISEIESFNYSYSTGMAVNSYSRYRLSCTNKCTAWIKPNNISEDNELKIDISKDQIEELQNILKKYEVGKWNGFDKFDQNVLDGRSFTINIKMKNGDRVDASGYMKWPKNFGEVSKEIEEFFDDIYKKEHNSNKKI